MRTPSASSRAASILLSAAVLWTAPGFAAHAAAATIVRELPPAVGNAGLSAAPALSAPALSASPLSAPSAPALSAPGLSAPAFAASPVAAAASPVAAAGIPAAAPALPAAAAPSDAPRSPLGAAKSLAASAKPAAQQWLLTRMFDGAWSGASRLAASVLTSGDDAPDYELPQPNRGLARVTLSLDPSLHGNALAVTLRRLNEYYGFKPERGPSATPSALVVQGTTPESTLLALVNSKDIRDIQVLSGAPSPEDGPRFKAAASRLMKAVTPAPAREPFVAATRRVAELEALAKSDPDKAYDVATGYIAGRAETRREVRLAALRALESMPLAKVLPFYQKILAAYADQKVQNAKAAGADSIWYIQRMVLLRFAREADALKSSPENVELAKKQYADRNASVRLAAAAALRAMGVEPGPETEYEAPAAPVVSRAPAAEPDIVAYHDPQKPAAPGAGKRLLKALGVGAILAVLLWGVMTVTQPHQPAAPATPPAVTQTVGAPQAPQLPAISAFPGAKVQAPALSAGSPATASQTPPLTPEQQALQEIARSEQRIAAAQEQQAAAAAKAAQGGGLFSGIGGMILSAMIFMGVFWLFGKLFKGGMGGGAQGGGMSASTEAKTSVEKPTQRFTDVEGIDESLVDVQEVLDYLKDPARFKRMGAKAPKGILFEGPPGTGKTLMARALAGETNSAFFAVSGSDFVELFVGMGARRVRELIQKAANHKPAIVFIDEIDAVGKARGGSGISGSDSEREQTINALLTGMDGFDNSGGIIFVAATNRADTLDPALLRPGRFDRKIYVGKPHMGGREAIATIHAKGKRLAPELDLAYVARRTAGLAGADIENIMNEAALQALRRGADAIGMQDVDEAIDRGTIGAKRSLPMPEALRTRVAYHEAGHVLANMLNENPEVRQKVNKFTIVPHGSAALGFAEMGTEEGDKYLYTREELEARIDHALGGLVAEKLIFGKSEKIPAEWSTGPGSDLEVATNVARTMVQTLGMGADTGLAVTAPDRRDPMGRAPFGDAVGEKTWIEVNRILHESYLRVTARLTRNRHVLEALTRAVLAKETLIGDEIDDVVRKAGPVGADGKPEAAK